ncbi:uncharacterized protein [Venturia canescens]|uniref:uncharacterized protein n=1 Tax=Venturia canescens TaxID=32260 RepID=UPI001C9C389F|nr:uncharacterized protein LOC122409632 [Venturia canescens]
MPELSGAPEKRYIWDEVTDSLALVGASKKEDEAIKGNESHFQSSRISKLYCPHGYLILNFYEALNPSQKMIFRKDYLRKVPPNEANVVILQDIKDLVLYLVTSPLTVQFINFFHLPIIDRFIRGLILYFQYYVDVWEEITEKRVATTKKAPNPLAGGGRLRRAEEMRTLRCVIGREYCEILLGHENGGCYHHMMASRKSGPTQTQSQGEKDLRIFEYLISLAHRIVWIALQRKYYNLIEVELHRLLRTDAFNTADRRSGGIANRFMLDDELRILQGPKMATGKKLLRNSPLPRQIVAQECDYRVLSLGIIKSADPRIIYLENALLAPEEKLAELGIKVGILGRSRDDFDIMLVSSDSEESIEEAEDEKDKWEKRKSSLTERILRSMQPDRSGTKMPGYGSEFEVADEFPTENIDWRCRGHNEDRERAREKWIAREMKQIVKYTDTISIVTTLD